MLSVESFFKINKAFVSVSEFKGVLPDDFYIEGAIRIQKDQQEILSLEDWDYIDQLWGYLLQGLENIIKGFKFKTCLPDQPTEIIFIPSSDFKKVTITVSNKPDQLIRTDYDQFVFIMLREATTFFTKMNMLFPCEYENELNVIKGIEVNYKKQ